MGIENKKQDNCPDLGKEEKDCLKLVAQNPEKTEGDLRKLVTDSEAPKQSTLTWDDLVRDKGVELEIPFTNLAGEEHIIIVDKSTLPEGSRLDIDENGKLDNIQLPADPVTIGDSTGNFSVTVGNEGTTISNYGDSDVNITIGGPTAGSHFSADFNSSINFDIVDTIPVYEIKSIKKDGETFDNTYGAFELEKGTGYIKVHHLLLDKGTYEVELSVKDSKNNESADSYPLTFIKEQEIDYADAVWYKIEQWIGRDHQGISITKGSVILVDENEVNEAPENK